MAETGDDLDLTDPAVARLLDRTTALAIVVATKGAHEKPPLDVPTSVRPLLRHTKMTSAARATLRRALHTDSAFRVRVAATLDEDAVAAVGEAGVVFLRRPDGWAATIRMLAQEDEAERSRDEEAVDERRAQRRLRTAEAKVVAIEADAAAARAEAEAARVETADARRVARDSVRAAAEVAQRLGEAERRAGTAETALEAARSHLAATLEELVAARTERDAIAADLATAQAEITGLRSALRDNVAPPSDAPPVVPVQPPDAAGAIALAGRAAAELGTALAQAAALLAEEGVDHHPTRSRHQQQVQSGPRRAPRRPSPLPPLVLEGSDEEADHLLRLDGVTVLVDGYNATIGEWPDLELQEQRRWLVDLLTGVAMRFGAHVEVVFDGAQVVDLAVPTPARRLVRVAFSPPDVEADDVIIERARLVELPAVVVSDDNRVRIGGRAAGANVLSVSQLLGAARRG